MRSSNDNRAPAEAVRSLPILGRVDPQGRVVLDAVGRRVDEADLVPLPSDPRAP